MDAKTTNELKGKEVFVMKRIFVLLLVLFVASLTACNDTDAVKTVIDDGLEPSNENALDYELLLHLDFIPHELGNTMTLVEEVALYQSWAEIFHFETIPDVDFAKEEVLFVTAYSNGCGLVVDTVTQQADTLFVELNYPEELRNKKDLVCTEIALANTYVMKMPKTGATKGTLTAPGTVLLEKQSILP